MLNLSSAGSRPRYLSLLLSFLALVLLLSSNQDLDNDSFKILKPCQANSLVYIQDCLPDSESLDKNFPGQTKSFELILSHHSQSYPASGTEQKPVESRLLQLALLNRQSLTVQSLVLEEALSDIPRWLLVCSLLI